MLKVHAFFVQIFILALSCFAAENLLLQKGKSDLILQNLDYRDYGDSLSNSGRGWYRTQGLRLKETGNKSVSVWASLTHLRVDISAFSEKGIQKIDSSKVPCDTVFGISKPLTEDALAALNETFANARNSKHKVIVRVSYDVDGLGRQDPPQEIILQHVVQLAKIYAENSDVIHFVELGMYGSWGEQHTSNNGSNAQIAQALQVMLENTPAEIKVGVRRPDIVAYWLGVQSEIQDALGKVEKIGYENFDVESEIFKSAVKAKGDTVFRVGMYNDGYLGNSSDLGTVSMGNPKLTREMMVRWLEQFSQNTPYGGEMVANFNGENPMNTARYLSYEGFRTHTNYLNWEWHYETIQNMKDSIIGPELGSGFHAPDSEYVGKSGYRYVEDHLGYRFVLRESKLLDTVDASGLFEAELKIQNVGFGNLTEALSATLVFVEDAKGADTCPTINFIELQNLDFQNIRSRKIEIIGADTVLAFDGVNDVKIKAKIFENSKNDFGQTSNFAKGYHVFLKVGDIEFANKNTRNDGTPIGYCSEETNGLYLGYTYVDSFKEPQTFFVRSLKNQKNQNQIFIERVENKILIRMPRKSHGTLPQEGAAYRMNGKKML